MDANRTYLLARNGMPGEYIVSHPFIARAPPSQRPRLPLSEDQAETMQRRDSIDSLDSVAREKEEAQTTSPGRSGLRTAFSKVARRLSGAGREKQLIAGRRNELESDTHEPFQVYVVGNQVVYRGPGSNRRSMKQDSEKTRKLEPTDAEKKGVEAAKERKVSAGPWDDAGAAHDARMMRRTS